MRANHYKGRNQIVWYKGLEPVWAASDQINNGIKLLKSQIQVCCSGCNLTLRLFEQPERQMEVAIGLDHGRLCCLSEQQVRASTYWLGRGRKTSKRPRDRLQRALLTGALALPPIHSTAPPDHSEAAANLSSLEQVAVDKGNTSCVWLRTFSISVNFAQGNQNRDHATDVDTHVILETDTGLRVNLFPHSTSSDTFTYNLSCQRDNTRV